MTSVPTLVIATGNSHKVDEIRAVLGGIFEYRTLQDFPTVPPVVETGTTFEANAQLKSESLAHWLILNSASSLRAPWLVLADDSGLEVDALGGAPGIISARFASSECGLAGNAPDAANNARLLRLLHSVPSEQRTARFRCVIALTRIEFNPAEGVPGENADSLAARSYHLVTTTCSGVCEGRIGLVQRGAMGFGYDPLFIPDGFQESLAELGEAVKNRISHRSRALQILRGQLPAV